VRTKEQKGTGRERRIDAAEEGVGMTGDKNHSLFVCLIQR